MKKILTILFLFIVTVCSSQTPYRDADSLVAENTFSLLQHNRVGVNKVYYSSCRLDTLLAYLIRNGAGTSIPLNRVPFGTGTGLTSSSNFTYVTASGSHTWGILSGTTIRGFFTYPNWFIANSANQGVFTNYFTSVSPLSNIKGVGIDFTGRSQNAGLYTFGNSTAGKTNITINDSISRITMTNIPYGSPSDTVLVVENDTIKKAVISSTTPPLSAVLGAGNDANATQITNLAAGSAAQDAVTVQQLEDSILRNNAVAGVPTVNDDETLGYGIGSTWFNIATGSDIYVCVDATAGAALWLLYSPLIPADNWSLTGNAGIDPSVNFIGTTDTATFIGRVNNHLAFYFGIPTTKSYTFMGYDAGLGASGGNLCFVGVLAGLNASGSYQNGMGFNACATTAGNAINGFGFAAAEAEIGDNVNGLGTNAASVSTGDNVNAQGFEAGYHSIGSNLNLFGYQAGFSNDHGFDLNCFGFHSGDGNSGSVCNFFGDHAGYNNSATSVIGIGYYAAHDNIISNTLFINLDQTNTANDSSSCIVYAHLDKSFGGLTEVKLNASLWINDGTQGAGKVLTSDAGGLASWQTPTTATVTSVSVVTANGFSGSVATATTTPAITLTLNSIASGTTATTQSAGDNSTKVATTAYVATAVSALNVVGKTYTPTLTNTTNVTSSTAKFCTYTRCDSVVTVYGSLGVVTTLAVATVVGISLPIASNLSAVTDLNGTASASSAIATNGYIEGETTGDTANLKFIGLAVSGSGNLYFSFSYIVK